MCDFVILDGLQRSVYSSQWDDVVLFDESSAFQDNRGRWLYTGITRAARPLTVVV
jgi:exodeoxyribonuclease-5